MFWAAALLGIIIGWLRNGKLKQLSRVSLPGWPLIISAVFIQAAVRFDFSTNSNYLVLYYPLLYISSFILLLLFVFLQNRQVGMIIIGLGILLNLLVITANRGMMPVDSTRMPDTVAEELAGGGKSPFHTPISEDTWLGFLGDRIPIPIPIPYFQNQLLSIGDIFMAAGIFYFIQHNMLRKKQKKQWR